MSKKKAFSGSTMTLKDFHGGSIPSDLPLPSAPGVIVRPSDRSGFDRPIPTAWGNPMARSDHRSRPGSSGATRNFDEKASFLSQPANIGRNFDEDERKPLDGVSVPRRTVSSSVAYTPSAAAASSYPSRFTGAAFVGVNSQTTGGTNGQTVVSSYPNAWGTRKEAVGVSELVPSSALSGPSAFSRFAQASALEKVSSGRWQSNKNPIHHPPDVEVITFSGTESDFCSKDVNAYIGVDPVCEREDIDTRRRRYGERGQIAEDGVRGGGKELLDYERARSPMYSEAKHGKMPFYLNGVRPASSDGNGGSQIQPSVPSEVSDRPKLKLLPRSKPLDTSEPPVLDYKQGYQSSHVETVNESYANANPPKPGSADAEGGSVAVQRPKLNLKPRSQPLEQERNIDRERKALFGGARPRELVLKERGIDDIAINNLDPSQSPTRVKNEVLKTETKPEPAVPIARYSENFSLDQRIGRDTDRKDHWPDTEKTEMQRSSWRKENRRNDRETEKQQERRPEPETWHKPVEQAKPYPPNDPGLRFGKAATALELAQSFSKSISDTKTADRFSSQRGQPGQNQVPFSRLTDTREFYSGPKPRHQINGY